MLLKDWNISSMVKGTCNSAKISCRTLGNGNLNVAGKMCRESSYKVDLHLHDLQTIYSRSVQFAYQSKSLEYTVLAKASRLKAAESGSSGFVMLPSGVTMTRLQKRSLTCLHMDGMGQHLLFLADSYNVHCVSCLQSM